MSDEKSLTEGELLALIEEHRADEHAARVRDYGEAGAADYEAGKDEAYRFRAEAMGPEPRQFQPIPSAEIDRAVADIERGWQKPYEQMLAEMVTPASPGKSPEKEPQR